MRWYSQIESYFFALLNSPVRYVCGHLKLPSALCKSYGEKNEFAICWSNEPHTLLDHIYFISEVIDIHRSDVILTIYWYQKAEQKQSKMNICSLSDIIMHKSSYRWNISIGIDRPTSKYEPLPIFSEISF